jgi:hypothetical protein
MAAEVDAVASVFIAIQLIFVGWGAQSRLRDLALESQEILFWTQTQRAWIAAVRDA